MPKKIMIIRHAEKPAGEVAGVSINGSEDSEDLTVRGWHGIDQRIRFERGHDDSDHNSH